MSTQLITDSTADLTREYTQKHNLHVIPMIYTIDDHDYHLTYDESDPAYIDAHSFYDKMRAGSIPSTTQVTQITYEEEFEPFLKEGKDVFFICFSSGLTRSYENALMAAESLRERYPERSIRVVDSRSASMGEGVLVHLGVQKHEAGMDDAALEEYLVERRDYVHHWFTVDDLVYLKRGGRVSGAAAAIGTMLNIKPMLYVDTAGHLIPREKIQGRKRALKALVDHFEQCVTKPYTGPIFLSHCDAQQDMEYVRALIRERMGREIDMINGITPVIGSHSGPGTVALFFVGDVKKQS